MGCHLVVVRGLPHVSLAARGGLRQPVRTPLLRGLSLYNRVRHPKGVSSPRGRDSWGSRPSGRVPSVPVGVGGPDFKRPVARHRQGEVCSLPVRVEGFDPPPHPGFRGFLPSPPGVGWSPRAPGEEWVERVLPHGGSARMLGAPGCGLAHATEGGRGSLRASAHCTRGPSLPPREVRT